MFRLDGKVALVTGAGRGIGKGIALMLAKQGAHVVLVDLDGKSARKAAEEVRGFDRTVLAFQADVAEHRRAKEVVGEVVKELGGLDILVNNAGIAEPTPFLELDEARWDRVMAVHLKGAFNYCHAALPFMLERKWGRIINISSANAKTGGGPPALSRTAYAAAKAGMLGLTRGLAREAAPFVTVNAICPGFVETDLVRAVITGEKGAAALQAIPLGRFGRPGDIASTVLFLASEEAGYITGEVMDVNGGFYID